ncbi:MAG TPA: DNA polymerase III subunit gamma/tau C-terminal domain-containing protein, partial [Pseudomonadales bacterium]|nr:DNA polymerase III subunit gamma/tau C-terminal domain-containing protein [Pseudomonadales bacterium]
EARVASGADQPAGSDRAGGAAAQPPETVAPLVRLCDVDASNWHRVLEESGLSGMARSVAEHCVPEAVEGTTLRLVLQHAQEILHQPQLDQRIAAALGARFGEPVTVSLRVAETVAETPAERAARLAALRQREAETAIDADANVRLLLEHFSARLHRESITAYTVAADGGEQQ